MKSIAIHVLVAALLFTQSKSQETVAGYATSNDGSFRISLFAPTSQKRGDRSEIHLYVVELDGSAAKFDMTGFTIKVKIMEADVVRDDLLFEKTYFNKEKIELDETYSIDLVAKERTRDSEVYAVVEVEANILNPIGVFSKLFKSKASTREDKIKVRRAK